MTKKINKPAICISKKQQWVAIKVRNQFFPVEHRIWLKDKIKMKKKNKNKIVKFIIAKIVLMQRTKTRIAWITIKF